MEMCDVKTYLIEDPDPNGPLRKGSCQGAVASRSPQLPTRFTNAVGVRIDEVPITPEKVLKALARNPKVAIRVTVPRRFLRSSGLRHCAC